MRRRPPGRCAGAGAARRSPGDRRLAGRAGAGRAVQPDRPAGLCRRAAARRAPARRRRAGGRRPSPSWRPALRSPRARRRLGCSQTSWRASTAAAADERRASDDRDRAVSAGRAREQVLERGSRAGRGGPGRGAAAARRPSWTSCSRWPTGADALVRSGGRGRGDHQPEDRRLPGGLPLLLAVRPVRLAGALGLAGRPEPGRGGQADRGDRRHRVLHRGRGARAGPAADGPGGRGGRGDPGRGGHPDRLLAGHARPRTRSTSWSRSACTATTTTSRRPARTSTRW